MSKQYTIKVYDKTGTTFKGTLNNASDYSFQNVINGGLGELSLSIPAKFNDSIITTHFDLIEIWVQDKETNGRLIYSGIVYDITRTLNATGETAKIKCLGLGCILGFTPDMATTTNPQVIRNGYTITNAIKDVIDKFIITSGLSILNYSATSVETSATTVSYTSNSKTALETIETLRLMAGFNWFWRIGGDRVFTFRQFPTTPTHVFTIGKEIASIEVEENSDDVINYFHLWNGLQKDDTNFLSKVYYNTASINTYGKRYAKQSDARLKDPTYFAQLGTAFINANKDINRIIKIELKDSNYGLGYDIESVQVGDTVRILNNNRSELFTGNYIIVGTTYTPQKMTLQIADNRTITSRKLNDLRKSLDTTVYGDGVNTLDLVSV